MVAPPKVKNMAEAAAAARPFLQAGSNVVDTDNVLNKTSARPNSTNSNRSSKENELRPTPAISAWALLKNNINTATFRSSMSRVSKEKETAISRDSENREKDYDPKRSLEDSRARRARMDAAKVLVKALKASRKRFCLITVFTTVILVGVIASCIALCE